ncbi:MAG: hypothetical protein LBP79_06925 [Clostridiales bacterium]|jgi:hypothetical protein|nr:hypothetical protein [Clostridiales bacterium]
MGRFNTETKVREVLAYPPAEALTESFAPGITKHPLVGVVKTMTLGQVFSYREVVKTHLKISDGEIDGFIEKLMNL